MVEHGTQVALTGIEPASPDWKSDILYQLDDSAVLQKNVLPVGFEPTLVLAYVGLKVRTVRPGYGNESIIIRQTQESIFLEAV